MDPNANLRAIRAEVENHLEHGDGDVDVLVERVKALDEWLSTGGFRPTPWQTFDRRTRPVRADDATHPRELPDEETFVEATGRLERQARRGTPEAIAAIEVIEHELRPAGWSETTQGDA